MTSLLNMNTAMFIPGEMEAREGYAVRATGPTPLSSDMLLVS